VARFWLPKLGIGLGAGRYAWEKRCPPGSVGVVMEALAAAQQLKAVHGRECRPASASPRDPRAAADTAIPQETSNLRTGARSSDVKRICEPHSPPVTRRAHSLDQQLEDPSVRPPPLQLPQTLAIGPTPQVPVRQVGSRELSACAAQAAGNCFRSAVYPVPARASGHRLRSDRGISACAAAASGNSFRSAPEDERTEALENRSYSTGSLGSSVVPSVDPAQGVDSEEAVLREDVRDAGAGEEAPHPRTDLLIPLRAFQKERAFRTRKARRIENIEDLDKDAYLLPRVRVRGEASWEDSGSEQAAKLPAWLESLFVLSWGWGTEEEIRSEIETVAGSGAPVPEAVPEVCVLVTSTTMANAVRCMSHHRIVEQKRTSESFQSFHFWLICCKNYSNANLGQGPVCPPRPKQWPMQVCCKHTVRCIHSEDTLQTLEEPFLSWHAQMR